jgi:hypothetical protein
MLSAVEVGRTVLLLLLVTTADGVQADTNKVDGHDDDNGKMQ